MQLNRLACGCPGLDVVWHERTHRHARVHLRSFGVCTSALVLVTFFFCVWLWFCYEWCCFSLLQLRVFPNRSGAPLGRHRCVVVFLFRPLARGSACEVAPRGEGTKRAPPAPYSLCCSLSHTHVPPSLFSFFYCRLLATEKRRFRVTVVFSPPARDTTTSTREPVSYHPFVSSYPHRADVFSFGLRRPLSEYATRRRTRKKRKGARTQRVRRCALRRGRRSSLFLLPA